MARQPTQETATLLRDDFDSQLNPAIWDYNHFSAVNNPSSYGRTQQRQSLPLVSNGVLHLQLDTFNPTAKTPGDSFLGSEAITNQTFAPTSGGGIAFEVRARSATAVAGMVGGIFGYNFNSTTGLHDEADFETLTNTISNGNNQEQTNVYSQEALGTGHPESVPDSDLTSFHTYRIEWFTDRVLWFIDNQLVRQDTDHVPQAAMALHLNIWAPASDWTQAYSASLQPASSAAGNVTYNFDVDYAKVARQSWH